MEKAIALDEDQLKADVDAYVEEVWEDVIKDINKLVQIRSVENLDHAAPGMPWGPASHSALVAAVDLAQKLGLDAHNCDGYIGYADLRGARDEQLATIAHTDVVPEGIGWHYSPFEVTRKDGFLIGRGVLDDKGPFVLSLYAAHFFVRYVKQSGTLLPYTLRCIIGNNEETGMGDLVWYLEHYPQPTFCFSPDADFPLICGEKGHLSGTFRSGRFGNGRILALDGGTVGNAIPGEATAVVAASFDQLPANPRIEIHEAAAGTARIIAHGKGGHASLPAGTQNAIGILVGYLLDNNLCTGDERTFLEMDRQLLASTDGSTSGVATADDKFGPLTLIGGTLHKIDGHFEQTIDSRFPTSTTGEQLVEALSAFGSRYGCGFTTQRVAQPFYMDPELPEMACLLRTYNEYTGRPAKAIAIGGGTYARLFKRAAAFGPHDPAEAVPSWVGMEHGPDEAISEASLKRALKIYIVSIARLMQLPLDKE
jgi:succinyl-diaminopimelate desuccinylase